MKGHYQEINLSRGILYNFIKTWVACQQDTRCLTFGFHPGRTHIRKRQEADLSTVFFNYDWRFRFYFIYASASVVYFIFFQARQGVNMGRAPPSADMVMGEGQNIRPRAGERRRGARVHSK